jgi:protein-disulfide isomerase
VGKRLRLAGIATAAVVVVAVAVAVGHAGPAKTQPLQSDAAAVRGDLAGVPQTGLSLGRADAPLTVVEFADLQCPFCRQFDREALPGVIDRYVRTGRVRLELRLLPFLGPDSGRAARVAYAAAPQGRAWSFADLFFRRQKQENTGYVTDAFLKQIADATPGLDARTALAGSGAKAVTRAAAQATRQARRLGVSSVPTLVLMRPGQAPEQLGLAALTTDGFSSALAAALRS